MKKHYNPAVLAVYRLELTLDAYPIFELRQSRNEATREGNNSLAAALDRLLRQRVHQFRHKHIAVGLVRGHLYTNIERVCYTDPDWSLLAEHIKVLTGIEYHADWLEDHNGCLDTINHEANVSGKVLVGYNA